MYFDLKNINNKSKFDAIDIDFSKGNENLNNPKHFNDGLDISDSKLI